MAGLKKSPGAIFDVAPATTRREAARDGGRKKSRRPRHRVELCLRNRENATATRRRCSSHSAAVSVIAHRRLDSFTSADFIG
jgi:hypothetical protein